MAASLKNRGGFLIISSGKKFVNQIWSTSTPPSPCTTIFWRRAHIAGSVYDKNVDDNIRQSVVPDDVIEAISSDKYWGPNPQTGVFGPDNPEGVKLQGGGGGGGNAESVLGLKAWFRPLEDIEKPQAN